MAFTLTAALYILALLLAAVLIFFVIYQIIAFDELKTDYKNPIEQCHNLNPLVLPEYFIHTGFTFLFLLVGELFTVLLNAPLIAYHAYRYLNRPVMSGPGLYDPTTIMNADTLSRGMREGWIKLSFYIVSFFYYLYRQVILKLSVLHNMLLALNFLRILNSAASRYFFCD